VVSVDAPQADWAASVCSWRATDDGLGFSVCGATWKGSSFMAGDAGKEAAAGTGGNGCRSYKSVKLCQ
jgi:hypothetical protein